MTPTQKPTQQPNQQWLDYLHRDEDFDDANKISAISEGGLAITSNWMRRVQNPSMTCNGICSGFCIVTPG
jgi:hypothetical protein